MTLTPHTRFGPYTLAEAIGVGGMGEVYRATDTNLKRDVAIKVLPESFAADADRLARFQREAEVLASLNHPNIAQIYGLEKADNITALVMELIDGPTLADRLEQGPIPAEEAIAIAMQIIEALTAAHERGIVHRDLKPANLKLKPDGTVKVLDFGIAKIRDLQASSGPQEATRHTPAFTESGVVLGTAAYMSPEQARGKPVDQRADIWAFGCVLYEMLTGQPAFGGEDVSVTLARILERGADLSALPPTLAPAVKQTILLCLEKDVRKRVADIRDVRLALAGTFETGTPPSAAAARGRRGWIAFAGSLLVIVALAIPALQHLRETPPLPLPPPPETRTDIVTPATNNPDSFALSPDGRQIVFAASGEDGESRLWLRSLSSSSAQPLPGTDGASLPFWSPDGRSIGFFAVPALKRLDFGGGASQTLVAPIGLGLGGSWSAEGVIVFAAVGNAALRQVSATGGAVTAATTLRPKQATHLLPHFLPDGRRFLFLVYSGTEVNGIYLGSLDNTTLTRLTTSTGYGVHMPSGWLLWLNQGRLVAQKLDTEKEVLAGAPVTVADGISAVSVAASGLIAYRTAGSGTRQLLWLDRTGAVLGPAGDPEGSIDSPRVAPDGRRVAFGRTVAGNTDLWLQDGARTSRLSFDAAVDNFPIWSRDGTRILFASARSGTFDLYQTLASGAGEAELIVGSEQGNRPTSWSADGRFALYLSTDPQNGLDLWVVPMAGERTPQLFLQTPFNESWGTFSPDGRWVAYSSNGSGSWEIYLRPFVPPGATDSEAKGQWQVSTAGGIQPVWRADGQELYYLNPAGAMMAVAVTTGGNTPELGNPETLFPTRIVGGGGAAAQGRQYDVSADGRFLINTVLEGVEAPITLLMNWDPGEAP